MECSSLARRRREWCSAGRVIIATNTYRDYFSERLIFNKNVPSSKKRFLSCLRSQWPPGFQLHCAYSLQTGHDNDGTLATSPLPESTCRELAHFKESRHAAQSTPIVSHSSRNNHQKVVTSSTRSSVAASSRRERSFRLGERGSHGNAWKSVAWSRRRNDSRFFGLGAFNAARPSGATKNAQAQQYTVTHKTHPGSGDN